MWKSKSLKLVLRIKYLAEAQIVDESSTTENVAKIKYLGYVEGYNRTSQLYGIVAVSINTGGTRTPQNLKRQRERILAVRMTESSRSREREFHLETCFRKMPEIA